MQRAQGQEVMRGTEALQLSTVLVPIPVEPEGCERGNHCVLLFNPSGSPCLSKPPPVSAHSSQFIVSWKLVLSGKLVTLSLGEQIEKPGFLHQLSPRECCKAGPH